ncbi:uncharacterized protein LOC115628401 [Scaptodrosophila lebanonensis]|uniref:Uncharacterized protein LOC115628401 n=1 Tax=Drosophila lebanonensis TaxID=7225 RepID=A0A6J2TYX3_DROLE|nr:uncharacterized protein LOC115628401 [Scaptodrosophila lebanonensis]
MSNTTLRPIPTLRGMFSVPRVTQERNFLKENKLSLRSLEKATTEKLAAREPVRPKWMRRGAPDVRESRKEERESENPGKSSVQNKTCFLRSKSQKEIAMSLIGKRSNGVGNCGEVTSDVGRAQLSVQQNHRDTSEPSPQYCEPLPTHNQDLRCQSCGSKRNSINIGIQTDDIMDEIYLTNALKKCNFDIKSIISDGQYQSMRDNDQNYYGQNYGDEISQELPFPIRANDDAKTKNTNCSVHTFDEDPNEIMPLSGLQDFNEDGFEMDEASLSARSRSTINTNVITKLKRRQHKLGSRDEVRLPRYLEKEKREKAEAVKREIARDPDCPRGHVLLNEQERLAFLDSAKQRFDKLINELNHMPMTTQTLRVRTRRAEIDKELTSVEDEIRLYSKPKIYIKNGKITEA